MGAAHLEQIVRDTLEISQWPKLKAVRHVLQDEPDDSYMLRDDFNRGIELLTNSGLRYDILIFERHLPQAIQFVDRHPRQTFILDHVAKPRIKENVALALAQISVSWPSGRMFTVRFREWSPRPTIATGRRTVSALF